MSFISSIGSAISGAINALGQAIDPITGSIYNTISAPSHIVTGVQNAATSAVNALSGAFNEVTGPVLNSVVGEVRSTLNDFNTSVFSPALSGIENGLSNLYNSAVAIPQQVFSDLTPTFNAVFNGLDNLGTGIVHTVTTGLNDLGQGLTNVGSSILSGLNTGINDLGKLYSAGVNDLAGGLNAVITDLHIGFSEVASFAAGAVKEAVGAVAPLVQDVSAALANLPVDFGKLIDSLGKTIVAAASTPRAIPQPEDINLDNVFIAIANILAPD